MKTFEHVNATTVNDAVSALNQFAGKAKIVAGGTDLLGTMIDEIYPDYPVAIVNIKTAPNLSYIKEEGGTLKIGALTTLREIAENATVQTKYLALAQAAGSAATPALRNMGTIGGNICQSVRCWYYRAKDNYFFCLRKGGGICYALTGDNRYHSIFGALSGCVAVSPSDIAPVLLTLNAAMVTSKRTINAADFWAFQIPGSTALDNDELVTEIQVPTPAAGIKSAFIKFALRKAIDFPVVNCAAAIGAGDARICLGAVFNLPYRATKAEDAIKGKTIDETNAEAAGSAALQDASALPGNFNNWKIPLAKALVKRTVLACK
jgi:xanthine dehydrogenase YagS FAD-binding subunit